MMDDKHIYLEGKREVDRNVYEYVREPALFERVTLQEIYDSFQRDAFRLLPTVQVTHDADMGAMVRTKDNKLVHLGIGRTASYFLTVIADNADTMSDEESKRAAMYIRVYRQTALAGTFREGPAFRQAADALLAAHPHTSRVPKERWITTRRLWRLLGKKN